MASVCSRCLSQKITTKLLCKQVSNDDVFDVMNSLNRCQWGWGDDILNSRMFIETFGSITWCVLHQARKLQSIGTEINDKSVNNILLNLPWVV